MSFVMLAASMAASAALADEPDQASRTPVPEPIFTETVTDIDGNEPGEVEFEANGSVFRSLHGGAYAVDTSIEAEWIALSRLGLRVEPTLAWSRDAGSTATGTDVGVSGGAALKLLQDFEREIFVHWELLARLPWDESPIVQPGDPALPLSTDLRVAIRRGFLTVRGGIGVGAFGDAVHPPLRASLAVLTPFEATGRFGFWAIEVDGDGARTAPTVAALNLVPNLEPLGLPFRFALALPFAIGEQAERPSVGIFLRVFYESGRELEFGEHAR